MTENRYQPSDEELFAAEKKLSNEQRRLSYAREEGYGLGKIDATGMQPKTPATERQIPVSPETMTGPELQQKLNLPYNPDILLLTIEDIQNSINDLGPNVSIRILNACSNNHIRNIYELITNITRGSSGKYFFKDHNLKNFGITAHNALNSFFKQRYQLELGAKLPEDVILWYKARSFNKVGKNRGGISDLAQGSQKWYNKNGLKSF